MYLENSLPNDELAYFPLVWGEGVNMIETDRSGLFTNYGAGLKCMHSGITTMAMASRAETEPASLHGRPI